MVTHHDKQAMKYVVDTYKEIIKDDQKFMKGLNLEIIKQTAHLIETKTNKNAQYLDLLLDIQTNVKGNKY